MLPYIMHAYCAFVYLHFLHAFVGRCFVDSCLKVWVFQNSFNGFRTHVNGPGIFTNIGVLLVLYFTFSVANFLLRFLLKSHATLLIVLHVMYLGSAVIIGGSLLLLKR